MNKLLIFCGVLALCLVVVPQINAQTRKSVSGAEVTGTFRNVAAGGGFSILALGKGRLRIAFTGIYSYKLADGSDMANTGEAVGEAKIAGDTATFTPDDFQECTITLKFLTRGRLKVTQRGTDAECGFGRNVSAGGMYKKISGIKPQF